MNYGIKVLQGATCDERCEARPRYKRRLFPHEGWVAGRSLCATRTGQLLAISFITVGELYFGAEKANWGEEKRKRLETTLRNFVVIPYDHEIARCYGRLVAARQRSGKPITANDAWIAACVVRHGVPLVTHNAKDFSDIAGLRIITQSS